MTNTPLVPVLIVDDEPLARRGLCRLVDAHPAFAVARQCGNGHDAVAALREDHFGLVLLDVEMPELDGFAVLAELADVRLPPVVFVTAYDHYAVRAFDAHALDYLMKPVDPERFARMLTRVLASTEAGAAQERLAALRRELSGRQQHPERLAARTGGRTVLVPIEEIDRIEAAGNYVRLHLGTRTVLHRETLAQLSARLDPTHFVRVHRSHVVQLARVRELHPTTHGDGRLHLADGSDVPVSRVYREALDQALGL